MPPALVPLTARELKTLHGLTVEDGLRMGYCIEGHVKTFRAAHAVALAQEQQALANPGYRYTNYRDRFKHRKKPNKPEMREETIIKEEIYTMDKNTRIKLLLCLMESTLFDTMEQTEKAALLTELLYGEKAVPGPAKHPGGRPKKKTAPVEKTESEES